MGMIPTIPETGVMQQRYVSIRHFQTVSDAKYLHFWQSGVTEFKVNQRIGGVVHISGTFEL